MDFDLAEELNDLTYIKINGRIPKKAALIGKEDRLLIVVIISLELVGKPDVSDISFVDVSHHEKDTVEKSLKQWAEGELIQTAFPYLTADERECMIVPNFVRRL